ncbi:MAG: response regulator [Nitrospira sp.]|nr:response regulator [Nitrospira sp.]
MDGYGKRVLIVGDNEDSRQVLSHLFAQTDYNIHLATDGLHALNEMTKRHFDAVILDYCMPSMEGGEFLLSSQATWPETPVIMLSGDAGDLEHDMIELGAFAWVRKPYETDLLLSLLLSAVRQPQAATRPQLAAHMSE